jgi:hypothetical protein
MAVAERKKEVLVSIALADENAARSLCGVIGHPAFLSSWEPQKDKSHYGTTCDRLASRFFAMEPRLDFPPAKVASAGVAGAFQGEADTDAGERR